jgi:hypothetical protein
VHDVGVVLTGDDVAGATHVCGKLINFVESTVHGRAARHVIREVTDHEVRRPRSERTRDTSDRRYEPAAFSLQPLDQMASDESSTATRGAYTSSERSKERTLGLWQ